MVSTSFSQLLSSLIKGFFKAVFEVVLTKVTLCKLQSSDYFYSNKIIEVKKAAAVGLVNVDSALKIQNVSYFQMLLSSIFHPVMVDGKHN